MRNFRPLQIVDGLDLLAEPAAHLRAGVGRDDADAVVLLPAARSSARGRRRAEPGVHLPGVQAERQRRAESERRVLAPIVIERGVAHLDGAVLHGVEHLQARHDLAGGEDLDLELVVGDLGDALGEIFAAAVERIERLRPACRQPPF